MPGQRAGEEERKAQILDAAYRVASTEGLQRLTMRRVAAEAGLSNGLVHFHFRTRDALVVALLDRLLEATTVLSVGDDVAAIESPLERLLELLSREMDRLTRDRRWIRLFFDFWNMGLRHPAIRERMQAELERYREAFRPMAEEVVAAEPGRFHDVTADGLAAVAVGFIKGCAVQSVIDPKQFDVAEFLAAAKGLMGRLDTARRHE